MANLGVDVSLLGQQRRVMRHPRHSFQLRTRPFEIAPFCMAPVLPGETLKQATLQSRAFTDPIRNRVCGWHKEYYLFYVKLSDMPNRDDFREMVLDQAKDMSAYLSGTATTYPTYTYAGGFKWAIECYQRIVEEYFRDEGQAYNTWVISTGVAAAKIKGDMWWQSLTLEDTIAAVADVPEGSSDLEASMRAWEYMRGVNLTNMSYEDWCASFGVRQATVERDRPELLRFVSDWQYPSSAVDPTDGSVAAAVVWNISERVDKDRFFKEPGFIFGVTVTRQKVYTSKQKGSASGLIKDAFGWLPAILRDDPATSLRKLAAGTGPLIGISDAEGYWVDLRDLFVYGDQMVNFALTDTDANFVALPNDAFTNKYYPTATDVNGLFVTTDGTQNIKEDGVVSLHILGRETDQT